MKYKHNIKKSNKTKKELLCLKKKKKNMEFKLLKQMLNFIIPQKR